MQAAMELMLNPAEATLVFSRRSATFRWELTSVDYD
jgi:hypothetical protein